MRIVRRPVSLSQAMLRAVYDYWDKKRAGREMPKRSDIVISELKPHLGWMMLVEALPNYADFRYRLVGSRITEYFLADAAGATMRATYALGDADDAFAGGALRLHKRVCTEKTPFLVQSAGGEWRGRFYPSYEALYLPLAAGHVPQVLVTYAFAKAA